MENATRCCRKALKTNALVCLADMQDDALPALERTRKQLGLRTVKLQDDNAKPHVAAWDKHGLDKAAERARWSGARGAASWLSRP